MAFKQITIQLALLLFSIRAICQHMVPVSSSGRYHIDYRRHSGELILNNGKNVIGIFQYDWLEFPVANFRYYSDSGKILHHYKVKDIKSIILLGADSCLFKRDSTYFVRMGKSDLLHKSLYRQLTFGEIKIYDPLINVDEQKGMIYYELSVLEDGKLKTFSNQNDLLKYIETKLSEKNIVQPLHSVEEAVRFLNNSNI